MTASQQDWSWMWCQRNCLEMSLFSCSNVTNMMTFHDPIRTNAGTNLIITPHYKCLDWWFWWRQWNYTTHALHLTSLWSNHHHRSKSLTAPSDMLHLIFWNQLHTSLRIPHPTSIIFHCFTLSSKPTFSESIILHLSLFLSVGLISWL